MRLSANKLFALGLLAVVALILAATAGAVRDVEKVELRAGDLLIVGRGGFKPETLPKHRDAPIKIYGGGKVSTISGELPPILDTLEFEFDRHGHVDTTGIEVCTAGKLQATTVPAARKNCPNAIVGKGFGTGDRRLSGTGLHPCLLADHGLQRSEEERQRHAPLSRLHHGARCHHLHRPGRDRKNPQRHLRLPGQSENPQDRRRLRPPDLRAPDGRSQNEGQGQAAQLRQCPLRNRPPAGARQVRLQGRHSPVGHLLPALQSDSRHLRRQPSAQPAARQA